MRRTIERGRRRPNDREPNVKYLFLIYSDETIETAMSQAEMGSPAPGLRRLHPRASRSAACKPAASRCSRCRPPPACAGATARPCSPTGLSPKPRSSWSAIYLVDCGNLDQALELAANIPSAEFGTIEVRPVMDFSADEGSRRLSDKRSAALERVFRTEWGRLLGGLVRRGGDLDLAEEALQEAAAAALEHWPAGGVPNNPAAWLATTAARAAHRPRPPPPDPRRQGAALLEPVDFMARPAAEMREPSRLEDDELRLLFLCCHPALSAEAQVALDPFARPAGFSIEAIAAAFLAQPAAIYQRLGRAKRKIAAAAIPFAMPGDRQLEERLAQVAHAVYLIFNEGYNASSGPAAIRADLCGEAIFLARRLARTFPAEPELVGLLALHAAARRPAAGPPRRRAATWCRSRTRTAAAG